jgi:hypothetical protein
VEKIRDMFARFDVSTDHSAALVQESRARGKSHELEGLPEAEIELLRRKTAESGQQLLLSDLGRFRHPKHYVPPMKAYREDLVGLAWCWGVVALLVGIAWGILQL